MSRVVPAARQLIREVEAQWPQSKIEVLAETDGLGFQRDLRITGATHLVPALEAISDPRIQSARKSNKGVRVIFVTDSRADHADPFSLAEVVAVLTE